MNDTRLRLLLAYFARHLQRPTFVCCSLKNASTKKKDLRTSQLINYLKCVVEVQLEGICVTYNVTYLRMKQYVAVSGSYFVV